MFLVYHQINHLHSMNCLSLSTSHTVQQSTLNYYSERYNESILFGAVLKTVMTGNYIVHNKVSIIASVRRK